MYISNWHEMKIAVNFKYLLKIIQAYYSCVATTLHAVDGEEQGLNTVLADWQNSLFNDVSKSQWNSNTSSSRLPFRSITYPTYTEHNSRSVERRTGRRKHWVVYYSLRTILQFAFYVSQFRIYNTLWQCDVTAPVSRARSYSFEYRIQHYILELFVLATHYVILFQNFLFRKLHPCRLFFCYF